MENTLDGRTQDGRFAQGNKGGPGNPYAQQTATVRALLAEMLTEDDTQSFHSLVNGMRVLAELAAAGRKLPAHAFSH